MCDFYYKTGLKCKYKPNQQWCGYHDPLKYHKCKKIIIEDKRDELEDIKTITLKILYKVKELEILLNTDNKSISRLPSLSNLDTQDKLHIAQMNMDITNLNNLVDNTNTLNIPHELNHKKIRNTSSNKINQHERTSTWDFIKTYFDAKEF